MKARLDEAMLAIAKKEKRDISIEPRRLHDLRRTFVTHLAELGVAPHVIELTVNHVSGSRSGIAGVYNRLNVTLGSLISASGGHMPRCVSRR